MIGVLANPEEAGVVEEFFQLFKTPWEFAGKGKHYDVLICAVDEHHWNTATLVLRYSGGCLSFDAENNISLKACDRGTTFSFAGHQMPVYGQASVFPVNPFCLPREDDDQESLTFAAELHGSVIVRIGYNLFDEVRRLLTTGQPPAHAGTPTIELHIELLRELITRSGIPLIEIPPVPAGYELIACLTHDVDHPVLRNHCLDHTMFGFLFRATAGSAVDFCRGRKSLKSLLRNWWAAFQLPFVYLGIAKDPWRGFARYLQIEAGLGSTYFVIPKRGCQGRQAPAKRAARYSMDEIKRELENILSQGGEVALHGIDAWLDSSRGLREQESLSEGLDIGQTGVRMHWLYFQETSPAILDRASFLYDSTVGYNETVGYRAGTAQAYTPLGAANLTELPLHVMDTALFYPRYLNLSGAEAKKLVWRLLDGVAKFGGALTINWHDRSIAPERLWEDFYVTLLRELKSRKAWFPTATQAVSWFKKRRSVRFRTTHWDGEHFKYAASFDSDSLTPELRVRVYRVKSRSLFEPPPVDSAPVFLDSLLKSNHETSTAFCA